MAKAAAGKVTDAAVAAQFREQIKTVDAADRASLRERVRLGAMLIKWEDYLGDGRGGRSGADRGTTAGEGLKGWIEKHLPELGYSAARGYKQLANRVRAMLLECYTGEVVQAALIETGKLVDKNAKTIIPDSLIEKREALFGEATSRRKLEQMWFEFAGGGAKRAGRPKGSKADYAGYRAEALQPEVAARALWSKVMEPAQDAGLVAAARLLAAQDCRDALAVLEPLVSALKARAKELAD